MVLIEVGDRLLGRVEQWTLLSVQDDVRYQLVREDRLPALVVVDVDGLPRLRCSEEQRAVGG